MTWKAKLLICFWLNCVVFLSGAWKKRKEKLGGGVGVGVGYWTVSHMENLLNIHCTVLGLQNNLQFWTPLYSPQHLRLRSRLSHVYDLTASLKK